MHYVGGATEAAPSRRRPCLVDGHAIAVIHLVKLVDAHHAAVSQNHGTRLQPALACTSAGERVCNFVSVLTGSKQQAPPGQCPLMPAFQAAWNREAGRPAIPPGKAPSSLPTRVGVSGDGSGQAHAGGAAAGGGDAERRDVHHCTQQLRLGHTRVSHLRDPGQKAVRLHLHIGCSTPAAVGLRAWSCSSERHVTQRLPALSTASANHAGKALGGAPPSVSSG